MTRRESLLAKVLAQAEGLCDEGLETLAWQAGHICRCGALMNRRSSEDTEAGERLYLICPGCGARKSRFLLCPHSIKRWKGKRKGARIGSLKAATRPRREGP